MKSVDWLLTAARLLKWVADGSMSSKSDAAVWATGHAKGSWRQFLPTAKAIRLQVTLADSPEMRDWLNGLRQPIVEACDELEQAMANRFR